MLDDLSLPLEQCVKKANAFFKQRVERINLSIELEIARSHKSKQISKSLQLKKAASDTKDHVLKNPAFLNSSEVVIGIPTDNTRHIEKSEEQGARIRPEGFNESRQGQQSNRQKINTDNELHKLDAELSFDQKLIEISLKSHFDGIKKWCSKLSFRDMNEPRKLSGNYIELESYLCPRANQYCDSENVPKQKLVTTVLGEHKHALILGTPGAGKTTSMKKLSSYVLNAKNPEARKAILLIRFRSLKSSKSKTPLIDAISDILMCNISYNDNFQRKEDLEILKFQLLTEILNEAGFLLILEGYDEISENIVKNQVLTEIRKLSSELTRARMIITCRTGEFHFDIDNLIPYEIAPLSASQIIEFSEKWLSDNSAKFIEELKRTPYYDTAIRPLTLGHLCAIYERYKSIPEKPKTIYKKVVNLLLEEWDEQRSITRETKYAKFEIDQKFELLSSIAYELTANGARGEFTDAQLRKAYESICLDFGLSKLRAEQEEVIREIESHTGLFLKAGVEKFEFAHKSIQEFLTADYLVRLPIHFIDNKVIEELGAELAIATAISSNSGLYLADVLLNIFPRDRLTINFTQPFLSRLVVEKPDFVFKPYLAVAILYLMSCKSFVDGSFKALFRDFLNKENLSCLTNYYKYDSRNPMEETITLKKCGNLKNYKTPYTIVVRNELELVYSVFNNEN